jgi:gas vesicle protein
MKDNSKLIFGLLIGAIAGAAISVFISSDKGQEIIDDIKDATGKAEKDFKKAINNAVDKFEDKISKGKEYAQDLANFLKITLINAT